MAGRDEAPVDARMSPRPRCARLERLDEHTLDAVADHLDAVAIVLESHIPMLLERLRPGEQPQDVLACVDRAVALCAARGIALEVEVPFRTENASSLADTVAYLGTAGVETVRVVPARDARGQERPLDPFACFSARYMDRIRLLCENAAQAKGPRLVWEPRAGASFALAGLPRFCEDAWGRVHVHADGRITPCVYAAEGELELGTLAGGGLDAAWSGRESLDLRRGHRAWDCPSACVSCPRVDWTDAARRMPFMDRFAAEVIRNADIEAVLEPLSPGALARLARAPAISIACGDRAVRRWYVAWSPGGTAEGLRYVELEPVADGDGRVSLALTADTWESMEPNVGQWWVVFAALDDGGWASMPAARCVVRHRSLRRLSGSELRYPGDETTASFQPPLLSPAIGDAEYDELVERVRRAVRSIVPRGAIAAVIDKGDERLRDLGDVEGWHFPRAENGAFAGFHPPDGAWAVEHLRSLQAAGAGYLVLPAHVAWWYDAYPQFTAYLRERCVLLADEPGTCLVVALEGGAEG